jgi:hypothetical protein
MELLKRHHGIGWFRYADYILIMFITMLRVRNYGTNEMQICM